MGTPFLGEIKLVSFNFPPRGWAFCNGATLPINTNQALFSLLGTTYGGNGQTTFALPDLRGRVPIHEGSGFTLGQVGGEQAHTLTVNELPTHTHVLNATSNNGTQTQANSVLAKGGANIYGPPANLAPMSSSVATNTGGSQAHLNMQPYLALNFCIALQGAFPSQN